MNATVTNPIKQKKPKSFNPDAQRDNILISWIIIGRNWSATSNLLIEALEQQNINTEIVELIIIDDGSNDNSIELLHSLKCENKKIIELGKQTGRCYARNQGIKLAKGQFCLFTNGNTIPLPNFLNKYMTILSQFDIDGGAGIINYLSDDSQFEHYLNNHNRGLKKFQEMQILPVEYVLFGNCIIKTELLKKVSGFNEKLTGYGGEELELLSRMEHVKDLTLVKIDTAVIRPNHPGLEEHCNRLREFGQTNFKQLPNQIQQKIIPNWILKFYLFIPVYLLLLDLKILNVVCRGKSMFVIKAMLGLSILRGYKD